MDFSTSHEDKRLAEFKELALSAGVEILKVFHSKRAAPAADYFIGSGKVDEIAAAVAALNAEVVLFNHELSAAQQRNLENRFKCRVIDRSTLILDIFAQRARSFEGRLQVELAQLEHLRTRLVRGWTHLERQKGGIGLRGPGETQLESDRRLLGLRIKAIKKELQQVLKQREQRRRARMRSELPTIALVGYTNAGKSTVFNRLTQAGVYVADQLFATLDPSLRQVQLAKLGKIIVADTVGFVRDLPHELIAAFSATLEETQRADLLLHVIDCSQDDLNETQQEVNAVLSTIEADKIPQLLVYNKIDLKADAEPRLDRKEGGKPWRVWLSAHTGAGFELLEEALLDLLAEHWIKTQISLKPQQGKLRAALYALKAVKQESPNEQGGWELKIELPEREYRRFIVNLNE